MTEFWTFAVVGFIAQLIDGTLGLGFGVISASVLLKTVTITDHLPKNMAYIEGSAEPAARSWYTRPKPARHETVNAPIASCG